LQGDILNIQTNRRVAAGSLTLAAVIASILGTAPVFAEDDQAAAGASAAGGLEEIVVTATRREQSLQDVPLAVTAISAESLSRANVTNLGDLSAGRVPGFVPTRFSGGTTLAISVRGVGLSDPTQGTTELTVPVYIDGVFLGRGQGLGMELIEPERIEILRGPQGQLFGRNAEGGVVQYVSRKPTGEFGVKASGSYGNYNDQRIKASIDLPEVFGISTQFSGLIASHDPYTEMNRQSAYPPGSSPPSPNYGHNMLDSSGGRFAARWNNDGPLTIDYSYDYSDEFSTEGYLTWLDVDLVRPATSAQRPSDDFADKTHEKLFNRGFQVLASGHNLTLNYQLNDSMSVKSITAYRQTSRRGGNTLGAALPAGVSSSGFIYTWAFENLDQDQTSQELQFIGTWDQFDLTAGAMWFNEQIGKDFRRSNLTGPGLIGPVSFIQPAALAYCVNFALDPCPTTSTLSVSETDSYGVYAQGNYRPSFLPGLELTLGLRYTDDQKDAERQLANGVPVNIPAEFSTSRVDPAAVIKYNWTENIQTYLRYATGYRAGGANVRSSNFTSFDEEENEAIELGVKSVLFDNRVRANIAVFQNTLKGEQLTIQEQPTTNPSLTNTFNDPNDRDIKGVEAELNWAITDTVLVGATYAYMDTDKWNEYDNPFTTVVDPARFYTVSTPKNSGSAYFNWDSGKMFFYADYSFAKDNYWLTPGALALTTLLPTFVRPEADMENVSARLGYHFDAGDDGKLTVALWGKNLTDNASIVYGFDGCAFGGGHCAFRQAPKTYGIEFTFDY
jgi:iron complex outermembrane recepter protein